MEFLEYGNWWSNGCILHNSTVNLAIMCQRKQVKLVQNSIVSYVISPLRIEESFVLDLGVIGSVQTPLCRS